MGQAADFIWHRRLRRTLLLSEFIAAIQIQIAAINISFFNYSASLLSISTPFRAWSEYHYPPY